MTVTQHGGTSSRALMAANGMPFTRVVVRTTVVRVASILVAVQPTWVGYSDGARAGEHQRQSNVSVALWEEAPP